MSDSNSLMNIGDLAKPVTTLIEKISDATGAIFQPWQNVRVAKADAEAFKIKALAEMEIAETSEIQKRTLAWVFGEQTRFQANRESVLLGAVPDIIETAAPEKMDNDWVSMFFEKCKLVSDEEMQSLWSRLLAGEANQPGTFTKRTVEMVSVLDKVDADLFQKLNTFVWNSGYNNVLIFEPEDEIYSKHGITFGSLLHLDAIGLINFKSTGGFSLKMQKFKEFEYFGSKILLENKELNQAIDIGQCVLTGSGLELSQICMAERSDDFFDYTLKKWLQLGYRTSSLFPKQQTENVRTLA